MRVLICGVIGAAAAAAAWLGLEHVLQKDVGWLAVLVGLVTGFSVHKGAGAATGGGYARGGLAALLALAAIVGGRQVYAKVMESVNDTAAPVAVVSTGEEAVVDDSGEVSSEGAVTVVEEAPMEGLSRDGGGGAQKVPMKKRDFQMEMVWMCAAALVAYIVGKGPDAVPVADEESEGESGEAPAESQEESSE